MISNTVAGKEEKRPKRTEIPHMGGICRQSSRRAGRKTILEQRGLLNFEQSVLKGAARRVEAAAGGYIADGEVVGAPHCDRASLT